VHWAGAVVGCDGWLVGVWVWGWDWGPPGLLSWCPLAQFSRLKGFNCHFQIGVDHTQCSGRFPKEERRCLSQLADFTSKRRPAPPVRISMGSPHSIRHCLPCVPADPSRRPRACQRRCRCFAAAAPLRDESVRHEVIMRYSRLRPGGRALRLALPRPQHSRSSLREMGLRLSTARLTTLRLVHVQDLFRQVGRPAAAWLCAIASIRPTVMVAGPTSL
jgi:hypothetical protein